MGTWQGGRARIGGRRLCCLCVPLLTVALALLVAGSRPYRAWREMRVREPLGWIDSERRTPPPFVRAPLPDPNGWDVYREAADLWAERRKRAEDAGEDPSRALRDYTNAYGTAGQVGAEPWRAEAEAVVRANEDVLAKLDEASGMECVDASEVSWLDPVGTGLETRELARLAVARGLLSRSDDDGATALRWMRTAYALGGASGIGAGVGPLLGGHGALAAATDAESRVIPGSDWDPEALRAHAREIRAVMADSARLSETLTREAAMQAQFYDWLEGKRMGATGLVRMRDLAATAVRLAPEAFPMDPKPEGPLDVALGRMQIRASRAWAADRMARLIEVADLPPARSPYEELADRMEADIRERGDPVAGLLLPSYARVYRKHWQVRAAMDAACLVACLEAHRIDHGAYPARLDDLVPKCIDELLPDPWSAEPLRYRPTGDGYTLYSVGPNAADDGGVRGGEGETFWAADLVFAPPQPRRMPEPPE